MIQSDDFRAHALYSTEMFAPQQIFPSYDIKLMAVAAARLGVGAARVVLPLVGYGLKS